MTIKLYHCAGTRSARVLWTLEEMGLAYDVEYMAFPPRTKHDGYLQLNPLGTVPLFIDGNIRMTESVAICHYLAEYYEANGLRVKPNETDYAEFLNWLYRSEATLTFPQTLVMRYTKFEIDPALSKVVEDYARWFFSRLRSLEYVLQERQYLCENRFTIADICIVYALYLADVGMQMAERFKSNTRDYYARIMRRPAIARIVQRDVEYGLF